MRVRSRFGVSKPVLVSIVCLAAMSWAAPRATASPCWRPPVLGDVIDPFRAPPCQWCAGNRGIEFRVGPDADVRAAATGTVTFVGAVVGVDYIVVDVADGWKLTYGQMISTDVRVGSIVLAGQVLGRASNSFYFGLRVHGAYTDPAPFVGTLRGRYRLIPVDGSLARPSMTTTARCQGVPRRR